MVVVQSWRIWHHLYNSKLENPTRAIYFPYPFPEADQQFLLRAGAICPGLVECGCQASSVQKGHERQDPGLCRLTRRECSQDVTSRGTVGQSCKIGWTVAKRWPYICSNHSRYRGDRHSRSACMALNKEPTDRTHPPPSRVAIWARCAIIEICTLSIPVRVLGKLISYTNQVSLSACESTP